MSTQIRVFLATVLLALGAARSVPAQPAPAPPASPVTLQDALTLARANSPQLLAATTASKLATEDRVQAKAGLLPSLNGLLQYIYTEPNGTPSGVFVPNDGPKVYYAYGTVHGDVYSPAKWAEYRAAGAGEAAAKARADVAARGLVATVVQNFYAHVAAVRKATSAALALQEAQHFEDITVRQERAGEVARSDVVKAQIQVAQRRRDTSDAELTALKSRLALAVLLFPDLTRENLAVVDDLQDVRALPPYDLVKSQAEQVNPDVRAAEASVQQETSNIALARSGYLPSISFDYFWGIEANQFATYNPDGQRLLGSSAQIQLAVPLWNWGAAQSKVRQAQLRTQQAQAELSLTTRELQANISAFYAEARTALAQIDSLKTSLDLATESLRLTTLRYGSGEVSVLEVVDAQATLVQARDGYNDGLVRYRVALAALQTLTGTL